MTKFIPLIAVTGLLAACGSNGSQGGSGQQIKIVGSSTVYPFTKAVSEGFQRANAGTSVIVESTGTGAGMKLFCGGVGGQYPDIDDASRPMKKSEYEACVRRTAPKRSSKCRSGSTG